MNVTSAFSIEPSSQLGADRFVSSLVSQVPSKPEYFRLSFRYCLSASRRVFFAFAGLTSAEKETSAMDRNLL